ncbi:aspartate aminotransferase [Methanosarcina thermophila]|jgi:aspartate/methionine/tyrosine aminotransferase|uniref:Aminotransferase n=3 Tax=Methanosarcina thermophila TaxID=2210 RepID=A0A1I6YN80_METTE|nr:pyridoxal phosphate-dependent aminotransferase [Methanosarcina thermophila]ALK05202.1 MAG: aspartate aminotransferase [Methanosarcina sp. 795]AKB13966.1 Valine--pyruvate aminotransferase [Methanosarcina thermophila TM-1]AKB15390.1 Valine--pyruvate aminotransferase [Methanosarcina thermophila CHTI-55]NLU56027.1 pyridoxal phosphate-dependent aminotransferase [Methanosarcina thermophila]SFT51651.1 aspartate aminotransferase [Methanosarcina thermophila]
MFSINSECILSKKSEDIPPFYVMEVLESAQALEAEGRHIIHLEVGEPDFPTAPHICEAACAAISRGATKYTHSQGLLSLREAIVESYHQKFGVDLSPDQVIITSGTSPALLMVFMALLEKMDEVIMSNPYYACYPNFVKYLGGTPVFVYTSEKNGFALEPETVRQCLSPNTKAILINSPSNPSGHVMSPESLKGLAEIADEKGIPIISDEIYQGLIYDGDDHTILEYTRNAFVLNGFSKLYAMTGWRLGYIICPPECVRAIQKIHQNFFICANSFVQEAAIAALKGPQEYIAEMVQTYNTRRQYMLKRLIEMGFEVRKEPMGAFYVLADARKYCSDSLALSRRILNEAGVAVTPGIDFGNGAEGYLRFSYANSIENIKEGMDRLEAFLQKELEG